jgi:hypothetical protein
MAQFTRVNGDFQQVMNYDAPAYTNEGNTSAVDSAVTVQPQGPKLEFFTITGNGSQVADNINAVFQTVQQLATVYMYEYTNATDDTLAIAVYPVQAWTTATLDTALTAAWTSANVAVTATATFTN